GPLSLAVQGPASEGATYRGRYSQPRARLNVERLVARKLRRYRRGALATSSAVDQAMPDQGLVPSPLSALWLVSRPSLWLAPPLCGARLRPLSLARLHLLDARSGRAYRLK